MLSAPDAAAAELSALIADPATMDLVEDDTELRLARAALEGPILAGDPTLLIALVGPSGTGRSTILNALAGDQLSRSGVLRPTTRHPVKWGEGGSAVAGAVVERVPPPPRGVSIVDSPPWDTDQAEVTSILAVADVALVVVNALRYADDASAGLIAACDRLGVPVVLALNRVAPQHREVLTEDTAAKLGRPPAVVLTSADATDGKVRVDVLLDLIRDLAGQASGVRAARRAGAVRHLKAATSVLLGQIALRREQRWEIEAAIEAVRRESSETIPVDVASLSWPQARRVLGETASASATETRRALAAVPSVLIDDVPEIDAEPALEDWHERTTVAAIDAVRSSLMRRLAASAVRRHAWRLAVSADHRPSWPARSALGASWTGGQAAARDELNAILATPSHALCDQARAHVDVGATPDGARIAELVYALSTAYGDVDDGILDLGGRSEFEEVPAATASGQAP